MHSSANNSQTKGKAKQILVAGPYFSNYSLAKVNRGLSVALSQAASDYSVGVWRHPNFQIDVTPSDSELAKFPDLQKLLTDEVNDLDVLIYCGFPASPADPYGFANMPGKLKLMYLFWEETVYPAERVQEVNEHLHGLIVGSTFVKKIMRQNGVRIPIHVVLSGINDNQTLTPKDYPLETQKRFKFFHNSTAKQRKGVDLLLGAYFQEFTKDDDVVLVIKSFPNPENQVNSLLGELTAEFPDHPEVLHIADPNLSEQEIIDLTSSCDCAVYPTRTEGFGMPIAEAMFVGTPVIATGYSAHTDFCNSENAFMIDYKLVDAIDSEAVNLGAKWAEPDIKDLRGKLRYVFEHRQDAEVSAKIENAKRSATELNWENAAAGTLDFIRQVEELANLKQKKCAVLTTQNTVCGIAEYSRDLYSSVVDSFDQFYFVANSDVADRVRSDDEYVVRLWEYGEANFAKVAEWLEQEHIDILHIQQHLSHFPLSAVYNLIQTIDKQNTKPDVYLTFHTLFMGGNDINIDVAALSKLKRIFVHKQADFDYLQNKGLENLQLFPLPYDVYPLRDRQQLQQNLGINNNSPIIVTHGIISEHKGLLETATAIADLKQLYPDIMWLAVNALNINNVSSGGTLEKLRKLIQDLKIEDNVRLFTDFLDATELMILIQSADLGLLAYTEVGESASAAVRKFLASGTPTIVTDIPMMAELDAEVSKIKSNDPQEISAGIKHLLDHKAEAEEIAAAALSRSQKYSWENKAIELLKAYAENVIPSI